MDDGEREPQVEVIDLREAAEKVLDDGEVEFIDLTDGARLDYAIHCEAILQVVEMHRIIEIAQAKLKRLQ